MKSKMVIILILGLILMFGGQVFAQIAGLKAADGGLLKEAELAAAIKTALQEGRSPIEVIKSAIDAGYSVTEVFQAAFSVGITLDSAIKGAIASGVTTDVIARSATSSGANPQQVAGVMGRGGTGFTYTPAGGTTGTALPYVNRSFSSPPNDPNQVQPFISRHGF